MTKDRLNLITKELFNNKKEKDCLRMVNGKLILNGKVLDVKQRDIIVSQAKEIKNMDLYQLLCNEMEYLANKKMYYDSTTLEDLQFGKAALWFIDIFKQKVDNLTKL